MNRNLLEGSERYSTISPNVSVSNERRAFDAPVPAVVSRSTMRRFSLTHESSCEPATAATTTALNASSAPARRRIKKSSVASNTVGTSTSTHPAPNAAVGHFTTQSQSSNDTKTTVDRNYTGSELLLTGEKIEPSRWMHVALTPSFGRPASHDKEFPVLRTKKPLVRTRSTDRDVDVIPAPTPLQQYERARRRSSYSGCFPTRLDAPVPAVNDPNEVSGLNVSTVLVAQPSRQAWERNRRTNSPNRRTNSPNRRVNTGSGPSNDVGPRPTPRRTITPPSVAAKVTLKSAAGTLKPKSSSLHTTPSTGFQADFTNFTQFNSSGITIHSHHSASHNSSSHDSFGSLGPEKGPVPVPCTPLPESRTPVLTLSARDTPSRRFSSPRAMNGAARSPVSPPLVPIVKDAPAATTAGSAWVVRSTPRGFHRSKSTASPERDEPGANGSTAVPASRHRRLRSGGIARAQSAERLDRPTRPPLSTTSSSSSLDEQRAMRRNRRTLKARQVDAPRESRLNRFSDEPIMATKQPAKATEYLNHSFNLSFSGDMSVEPDSPEALRGRFENEIATPAIFPKKLPAHAMPNFAIPQSPVKQRQRMSHVATVDEVSENNNIDDLLEFEQELEEEEMEPPPKTGKELYECARRCAWDMVAQECCDNPWTAKYVCDLDGTTALHLAVISRANPVMRDGTLGDSYRPAPLELIEQLVMACPEAAIIRCSAKRYTPLSYASLVADTGYDMDDSAAMIDIILKHNPHSALVFTDDGFSAVDVHIISYSRLHQEKAEVYSHTGRSSTVVLRALLDANPSLALVRSYGNRVRGPVELLYRCNLNEFKEATGADIIQNSDKTARSSRSLKKHACSSVVSTLSDWWAWKWALLLLKVSTMVQDENDDDEDVVVSFSAVHAASHLVGCPIPVLALAIDAFPELARTRNPRSSARHNCPLHEVCSWVTDDLVMNGDPFVVKRKRKAIAMLLEAFPKAARMTNSLGETPLQLAIETCTPWDSLEKLVKAFPKALTLPRSMEHFQDDSPLAKAVAYHNDDVGSVGSNEDEWDTDAIDAVEGMYPFMVAGVLSHVPDRRNYAETLLTLEHKEVAKSRKIKDLESLRSIFGLLRAQPKALGMFLDDEVSRRLEEERKRAETAASVDDETCGEEETCTEAYVEDAHVPVAAALEDNDQADYEVEESYYTEEEEVESEASDYTEIEEVSHL